MRRSAQIGRRVAVAAATLGAALLVTTCTEFWGPLSNPVDAESESYQGFPTVTDADDVVAVTSGEFVFMPELTASEVLNATGYRFRLETGHESGSATTVWESETESHTAQPTGFDVEAREYRWQVQAQQDGAWGEWSLPPAAFTMVSGITIVSPEDGATVTDTTPTLDWEGVAGAAGFEVQIADTEAGVESATAVSVTESEYTYPTELSDGDELHWRVRAENADGRYGVCGPTVSLDYSVAFLTDSYFTFQTVIASGETGIFEMGSAEGEADEQPVHTVRLTRSYEIGTYEITNAQYAAVLNEALSRGWVSASSSTVTNTSGSVRELLDLDGSHARINFGGGEFSVEYGYEDHPVLEVTWYGAAAFAYYLNELEGREQPYNLSDWSVDLDAAGYRLPTEAEWEYAARGGAQSSGYRYAGSDTAGDVAWTFENAASTPHVVGTKAANELGTYDMSGNVNEWCSDWYGSTYYSSIAVSDPGGPASGSDRVLRGGGWLFGTEYARLPFRNAGNPELSWSNLGFRLVRPQFSR